ncbi:beta/alpha barrel domain-containing protein, partial [Staphylococcus epidermidis]|uniref:hypothetical protein n=1 Tax=Staphylococcus epidermidis TaxID=1282 RepID=UPI001C92E0AA
IQAGYFHPTLTSQIIHYYQFTPPHPSAIILQTSFLQNHPPPFPPPIPIHNHHKIPPLKPLPQPIQPNRSKPIFQLYHPPTIANPKFNQR